MVKKINENVVVLEEYTTSVEVPIVGTAEHRMAAVQGLSYRKYVYRRTNTYIYVGISIICPTIVGKKLFNRIIPQGITLKGNKLYGSLEPRCLKYIPKFEWIDAVPANFFHLLRDKNIMKQILRGKITSKTSLLKSAGKIHYKGDYTPKNVETLITKCTLSVHDLDAFCKEGAKVYLDRLEYIEKTLSVSRLRYESILQDLIKDHQALGDDYYFSCKWSFERLQREHQHSIMLLKQEDLARCSTQIKVDCIYKEMLPVYVDLIDNERSSCEQALVYDNCSYRIYWPQVQKGNYLLLVDNKNNIMVGIRVYGDRLLVDQYHTYHNGDCEVPDWLQEYVAFHNERLNPGCPTSNIEIVECPF